MDNESNEIYVVAEKVVRAGHLEEPGRNPEVYTDLTKKNKRPTLVSPDTVGINLREAYICDECDTITNNPYTCPRCSCKVTPLTSFVQPVHDQEEAVYA